MATQTNTPLSARRREVSGSRSVRRLRREGVVPGIVYGGGEDPVPFGVDSRELRHALADAGAVLDLQLDGAAGTPVVLKELVRHPVNGATVHIDLLRVNLNVAIQTTVVLELTSTEEATGVRLGGVLEQPFRELTIEALPNEIPDVIQHDVAAMEIGDSLTLAAVTLPPGVTIIDDLDTVIATLSPPRLQALEADTEIETETEVVGEEGAAEDETADEESAADASDA